MRTMKLAYLRQVESNLEFKRNNIVCAIAIVNGMLKNQV